MNSSTLLEILDACLKLLKENEVRQAESRLRECNALLASQVYDGKIQKVTEINITLIEVKKYIERISSVLSSLKSEHPRFDFYEFEQQLTQFNLKVHDLRHEKRKISKS